MAIFDDDTCVAADVGVCPSVFHILSMFIYTLQKYYFFCKYANIFVYIIDFYYFCALFHNETKDTIYNSSGNLVLFYYRYWSRYYA